jgi:anaerobic magnesium-protoporphyrin IX monomethyl ester cyclase
MSPPRPKKILLLNPPLSDEERAGALATAAGRSLPYGLLSVAAVTRQAGYQTLFMDAENSGYSSERTARKILAEAPDYLGISTVTLSVERAAELARDLKDSAPGLTIIAGGPHMSSAPDESMQRFPAFDVGVIGEAEVSIVNLLRALDEHAPLSAVKGIIYRDQGRIVRTPREPPIQDLDALPLPAWDLVPDLTERYRPSAPSYIRLPSTTIVTSRGCSGTCIFCNSVAIHGRLRCFSAEYVLGMVRHLQRAYGIRDLSIYDDNFLFHADRVEKFCHALIDEKIDLTWSCYSRVDQGNFELFRLMKRAGCWQLSYGVESGSQQILDFIRKKVTLEQIEKTISETKRAGLRTRGFFMIGHLTETRASIRETIAFMQRLPLDDFHFTAFTPLPGTHAYRIADQYGAFDRTWSKMNLQYPAFVPHGLTAEEMETYSKQAYRAFYFRPRIILSYLRLLVRHPRESTRLFRALQALVARSFFTDQSKLVAYAGRAPSGPASGKPAQSEEN